MAKRTLLQLIPALGAGGAERGALDVAKAAREKGWHSLIATSGGHLVAEAEEAGVTIINGPFGSKNPLQLLANARHLRAIINEHGPDIIHVRSRAPAWALRLGVGRDPRIVTTYHGTYNAGSSLKRAYNRVMAEGMRVIGISEFIMGHVASEHPRSNERLRLVPRGIRLDKFPATDFVPPSVPRLLLPGRLTRWKGQLLFLEALALLKEQHVQFHASVMGDAQGRDAYVAQLHEAIGRLDLGHHVELLPASLDMASSYQQHDLVVVPSLDPEAFGRVPVEAQAAFRPVVAADHGGASETMGDEGSCFPVRPGDAKDLARGLKTAITAMHAPDFDRKLLKARQRVVALYGLDQMIDKTFDVYEELLAHSPNKKPEL